MSFVRRMMIIIHSWGHESPDPYTAFVDEESERLVELVLANAAQAVETARASRLLQTRANEGDFLLHVRPNENDFVGALIDKLQEAGF